MAKKLTKLNVGIKHGFRSGLEEAVNLSLQVSGKTYEYEKTKIEYVQPAKVRTYLPDFSLTKQDGMTMFIETKGRWTKDDRVRFDWIFEQHPDLDIRFIFQNPNAKIYKGSKTTYAQYCDKKGWLWAKKSIPSTWLDECL
jgi:hypothetical protein